MSVSTTTTRVFYTGDGSTTGFTIPFYFKNATDIVVLSFDPTLTTTPVPKVLGSDYTITAIKDTHTLLNSGGTVNFIAAPTSGFQVEIYRLSSETQTTTYNQDGSFPFNSHEAAIDYLTFLSQEHQDIIRNRTIRYPDSENISVAPTLPIQLLRKNTIIGFDTNGNFTILPQGIATPRGVYVPGTAYHYLDFFSDPATGNVYVALKAYTAVSIAADTAAGNIILQISAPTSVIVNDYSPDTGAANAYVVTLAPAPTSYTAGLKVTFKVANANTGASTINVNALGIKNIRNRDLTALSANQLLVGMIAQLEYDGTQFQLTNQLASSIPPNFNAYLYATATGTNTYTATVTSFTYASGNELTILFTNGNTGAATLNVNTLGAKAIQVDGNTLVSGQIPANWTAKLLYDGTQFQLLNPFTSTAVVGSRAIMQEQQTSGTGPGNSPSNGAFVTRQLNTKVSDANSIISTFNSGGNFQFIPIAGTYSISAQAVIGGGTGGRGKLKLRNVTQSSDAVLGINDDAGAQFNTSNFLDGPFVANGTDSYALQHFNNGGALYFGLPVSQGLEIYSSATITKIA